MSLRWRWAILLGAAVTLAFTVASVSGYVSTANELTSEVDDFLLNRFGRFTPGVFPDEGRSGFGGLVEDDVVVQLINGTGGVIAGIEGRILPVDAVDQDVANREQQAVIRDIDVSGVHYRVLSTSTPFEGIGLLIGRDLTANDMVLEGLRNQLVLLGIAAVAFAALIGWFLAGRTAGPVTRISLAAQQVAATQDFDEPIAVERDDEVGRLAHSFNTMLAALNISRQQQRRLVMDASHELRTPLTALRTNLELLLRAPDIDPEERRKILEDSEAELTELTAMMNELVDLAADPNRPEEAREVLPLDEVVGSAIERAARRTTISIDSDLEPCRVVGVRSGLERAVSNLIDNAVKWSPADGHIDISLAGGSVEVRDRGPGISDDDLPFLFERFYRSAAARSQPGSGLGLAIVKQIVENHGGEVWARNAEDGGAIVGFSIPTVASEVVAAT